MSEMKKNRIAVYGLGTLTETFIKEKSGNYEIVGLLDSFVDTGNKFGYPIVRLNTIPMLGIKLIVVAARPGSCKVIARKIGDFCRNNKIKLIDCNGENLLKDNEIKYDLQKLCRLSVADAKKSIDEHDIISFDFFDTVVMRKTLFPTDIFEILDKKIRSLNIIIEQFPDKRLKFEKELSRNRVPNLLEIYEELLSNESKATVSAEYLALLEFETDYTMCVQRREVCDLIEYAYKYGKKVYITSDSYYSKEDLKKIARKCGVVLYDDLIVSSEYGVDKSRGLFLKLIEKNNSGNILHFGDDLFADIESAENSGISSFQIHSGIELFEAAGAFGFEFPSLSERIRLGMMVSKIFNSPFRFSNPSDAIEIYDSYNVGYIHFAPIISDFVLWLSDLVNSIKADKVLFCARDGYLLKDLFDKINKSCNSVYFYTSRICISRAAMDNVDDIEEISSMTFSGDIKESIKVRFGVDVNISADLSLQDYADEILKTLQTDKLSYLNYLNSLNLNQGKIVIVDLVAKGTCQKFIEKILNRKFIGAYFLNIEEEYAKCNKINIKQFCSKDNQKTIYEDYYLLEPILSAPHPSIISVNENLEPVYSNETRNPTEISCLIDIQEAIKDYFNECLELCPELSSMQSDKALKLIHKINNKCSEFLEMRIEDPFFNRVTIIDELI